MTQINALTAAANAAATDQIPVDNAANQTRKITITQLFALAAATAINWTAVQAFEGATAGAQVAGALVTGDVAHRWVVGADGKQTWGDGTGAGDTNLYRSAANTLKTDDDFIAASLTTAGALAAASAGITGLTTATGGLVAVAAPSVFIGYSVGSRSENTALSGSNGLGVFEMIAAPASSSSAAFQGVVGYAATKAANAQNLTANVGLTGVRGQVSHLGSGSITAVSAFVAKSAANTGGGTIANAYAVYLENQTVGENNWGLYSAGANNNFFAGNLGIGMTPVRKLDVTGTFGATGAATFGSTVNIAGIASIGAAGYTRLGQLLETNTSAAWGGAALNVWSTNGVQSPLLDFNRSKSGTIGTHAIVASGDSLGGISFRGSDGTGFINAATIEVFVDGTPGTNDMPGRIIISTTADGASTSTERMRITSAGLVGIGTTAPQHKLQVLDALKISDAAQTQGRLVLGDGGSTTANVGIFRGAANALSAGNYLNLCGYAGISINTSAAAFGAQVQRALIDGTTGAISYWVSAQSGVGETLASWFLSDDATAKLELKNNATSNGVFQPMWLGTGSASWQALVLRGDITTDSGTNGVLQFQTTMGGASAVTTRPLFNFLNFATTVLQGLPLNSGAGLALNFAGSGTAAPAFTTRSIGTRLILSPSISGSAADHAIGVENQYIWISVASAASNRGVKLYGGETLAHTLRSDGLADHVGTIRTTGATAPTSGAGLEMLYLSNTGQVQSYDRTGSTWKDLQLKGLTVALAPAGTAVLTAAAALITCAQPLRHARYTLATLPSAATAGDGSEAYCTDHTGGARPVYSDGTNWRDYRTGNVAA